MRRLATTVTATSSGCRRDRQVVDEVDLGIQLDQLVRVRARSTPRARAAARAPCRPRRSRAPARGRSADRPTPVIPIARRMPISRVLSATTIVSVLTMLNAATSTISNRMTPMPSFSSLSAWNSELFCSCQSTVRYGIAELSRQPRADLLRLPPILRLHLEPGHAVAQPRELLRHVERDEHVLVVVLVHPRVEDAGHLEPHLARHVAARSRRSTSPIVVRA